MKDSITNKTIDYVESLAKLELAGDEKEQIRMDIRNMLDFVNLLKKLDTHEAEPMFQIAPLTNVYRDDVVTNDSDSNQIMKNAPESKEGYFVVPKIVES